MDVPGGPGLILGASANSSLALPMLSFLLLLQYLAKLPLCSAKNVLVFAWFCQHWLQFCLYLQVASMHDLHFACNYTGFEAGWQFLLYLQCLPA